MAVESVFLGVAVDDVRPEQRQYAPEALAAHEYLGGHNLVAQTDGLAEEFAVEVHVEQPLPGGVARVEQSDVHLCVCPSEVVAQDAVVEQQLYVVVLLVVECLSVCSALYVVVLARLLFHQQPHVAGHQVDASLQSQAFADERRLQQRPLAVVARVGKERCHRLLDVGRLLPGVLREAVGIEVAACRELQCLFAEEAVHRLAHRVVAVVDDIVQGSSGEVT